MKKYLPYIFCLLLIIIAVSTFGSVAHAYGAENFAWLIGSGAGQVASSSFNPYNWFADLVATVMDWAIRGMSWVVAIAGALLNFSINLTLHIKDFVDSSPAIYNTWRAIRDISSMFIIFFLLYAAIKLILGFDAKFGSLIKNIVIAGVLINFSFFFAGLGIDASNIISMQLYNAIAPANPNAAAEVQNNIVGSQSGVTSTLGDGGLSDIFMNSLKIQTVYDESLSSAGSISGGSNGTLSSVTSANGNNVAVGATPTPVKIFLAGIVAVIIELCAALSFAVAAFAFIIRFVILLLLLAFSPIWFALQIFPKGAGFGQYAEKWTNTYKGMLIFMPVYLLLMYLALNVLTTSSLFGSLNNAGVSGNGAWYGSYLVLGVNAAIVFILINAPLVAAASIAGTSIPLLNKAVSSVGAGAILRRFNPDWKGLGSQAGSRTLGRIAYSAGQSGAFKKLASSSPVLGGLTAAGLSKVSSAGFGGGKKGGYEERLKDKKKAEKAMHKRLGTVERGDYKTEEAFKEARRRATGYTVKREDYATDEEFEKARKKARGYQGAYRENLPWKGPVGSIVGFVVDNRANRQTAAELSEDVRKKALVKQKSEIKKNKDDAENELRELNNRLNAEARGVGFAPGKQPSQEDLNKRKSLEDKINGYQKTLDEIEEVQETEMTEKIAGAVVDKTKADNEGRGKEKQEDKNEGGEAKT